MKIHNVKMLKNKICILMCISIIFSIFCTPVSAVRAESRRVYTEREDIPQNSERGTRGTRGTTSPTSRRGERNVNLTQLDLGEDFLFKADPNIAQYYSEVFHEFVAAINQNNFNFNQALQIANNNGMIPSGSIDNSINQSSGNVDNAISQISSLFNSRLGSVLSDDARTAIYRVIQDTFNTHISSSNYIVYSSKSGSDNSYLFKVLAGSIAVNGNQTTLTLVPVEITVHVKVKVKKILFVTISSTKDYDVQIKAQSFKKTITL